MISFILRTVFVLQEISEQLMQWTGTLKFVLLIVRSWNDFICNIETYRIDETNSKCVLGIIVELWNYCRTLKLLSNLKIIFEFWNNCRILDFFSNFEIMPPQIGWIGNIWREWRKRWVFSCLWNREDSGEENSFEKTAENASEDGVLDRSKEHELESKTICLKF